MGDEVRTAHGDIRPPLALYVVWHPKYAPGHDIGKLLRHHFDADLYHSVTVRGGIPVLFRNSNSPGSNGPLPVDLDNAHATAVVVLVDRELAHDDTWMQYVKDLVRMVEDGKETRIRVFPVIMEQDSTYAHLGVQEMRWDKWTEASEDRNLRLLLELAHALIIMLMGNLAQPTHVDSPGTVQEVIWKVKIFLSHSHRDGLSVANEIRDWLHNNTALDSFFAPVDITPGMSFRNVIDQNIRNSSMLIIYTDSYSSRNWCAYEVTKAKRESIPIVVVDCLHAFDNRSFPYLGNTPVIRLDPRRRMISKAIGLLLDEILRDFLWRYEVQSLDNRPLATFTSRPPELSVLATLPKTDGGKMRLVVYPDPPLSSHELELFADVDSNLRLLSLRQWKAEAEA